MTCESSNHITDKNLKDQIIKEKRRDHKGLTRTEGASVASDGRLTIGSLKRNIEKMCKECICQGHAHIHL